MDAVGSFIGGLLVLLSSMLLLVLVAMWAGLMATLMVNAFLIGWEVL